jgi:hypothetical protein
LEEKNVSQGWVGVAGVLVALELFLLYEAVIADIAGLQRIMGVFAGLAILCFAALLYSVSSVFYGW